MSPDHPRHQPHRQPQHQPRRHLLARLQQLPAADELTSVLANLRLLLNTRPGDSPADPEFGVPDLADLLHQFPAASTPLQHGLQRAIARHEPRLRAIQVRPGTDHTLEIHAQFGTTPLRLRAHLSPSGRIDLA